MSTTIMFSTFLVLPQIQTTYNLRSLNHLLSPTALGSCHCPQRTGPFVPSSKSQKVLGWERSHAVAKQWGLASGRKELLRPSESLPPLPSPQFFTSIIISKSAIASEITSSLLYQIEICP